MSRREVTTKSSSDKRKTHVWPVLCWGGGGGGSSPSKVRNIQGGSLGVCQTLLTLIGFDYSKIL